MNGKHILKTIVLLAILHMAACGAESEPQQAVQQNTQSTDTETEETPSVETLETAVYSADLEDEQVGAGPVSFIPVVGFWTVGIDDSNTVLFLDGSRWEQGQTSANIAEQARELYGDRYSEFLDNVQAYAYYPFAIAAEVDNFTDGEITLRFKNIAGRIDQNAGILFDLKPNGDYYTLRGSSLENNLVLWRVVHGNRSSVEWIRNTPTSSNQWHDLKLTVSGREIRGYLDGQLYLEYTLEEPVEGRVGVWSKADSQVYFDDFTVTPEQ